MQITQAGAEPDSENLEEAGLYTQTAAEAEAGRSTAPQRAGSRP